MEQELTHLLSICTKFTTIGYPDMIFYSINENRILQEKINSLYDDIKTPKYFNILDEEILFYYKKDDLLFRYQPFLINKYVSGNALDYSFMNQTFKILLFKQKIKFRQVDNFFANWNELLKNNKITIINE